MRYKKFTDPQVNVTAHKIALAYNGGYFGKKYPASWLREYNFMATGAWFLGNDYQNTSAYYGAYPPRYLARMETMLPRSDGWERVCHAFSGSLEAGDYTRIDINPANNPDIVGDVCNPATWTKLKPFDVVYADPPYSRDDAKRYGFKMPDRRKTMIALASAVRRGGLVVWLDTVWPLVAKDRLQLIGTITIFRSCNHRVRAAFVFQRP